MKSWLIRVYRGRRLDRNPLRRPSDRGETLAIIWLLVICAITAPLAARGAAAEAGSLGQHARATAIATRHQITAITLQATPPPDNAPFMAIDQSWINVKWTVPDGRARTGTILVDDGTPKSSPLRIWVTTPGDLVPPPLTVAAIGQLADVAAASAVLGVIVTFAISWALVRYLIGRRRLAAWDAGWAAIEPHWNRQSW
jgi:hypothetical protein